MQDFLIFFIVASIGGFISVPIGGSFLFVIPAFLFLGLDGLTAVLLGRILMIASMGSASGHFFLTQKFEWKRILFFLSGNFIGYAFAAKLLNSLNADTVTKLVPWVLLIGSILLIKDVKITNQKYQKIILRLIPFFGLLLGFYAGLGGGGNGKIIVLLLTLALNWQIKKSIINTRLIELIGNIIAVTLYLYFGTKITGHEIPVILGGLIGGYLGAKVLIKSKPSWLKYAFLFLVLVSAIKVSFF